MKEKVSGANEASIYFKSVAVDESIAEQVRAKYMAPDARIENPWYIYRVNAGGRYYIKVDENLELPKAPAVSTVQRDYKPESTYVTEWKIKHGDRWQDRLREAADYGNWLHILFARMIDGQPVNLTDDAINVSLENYCRNGLDEKRKEKRKYIDYEPPKDWVKNIRPDLLALVRWAQEWSFKALAVEIPVWFDGNMPYAGVVDLVGWVTEPLTGAEKKDIREKRGYLAEYVEKRKARSDLLPQVEAGDRDAKKELTKVKNRLIKLREMILKRRFPKKVPFLVIVDLKSGRKGFWPEHAIQLRAYRFAWNWEHARDGYFVRRVFNLAPNGRNPRGDDQPYNFVEQTNHKNWRRWLKWLQLWHYENDNAKSRKVTKYQDVNLSLDTDLSSAVAVVDPIEQMRESIIAQAADQMEVESAKA